MHDLLIRNALLLDGLGTEPLHGHLAVRDGRIVEMGEARDGAREVIEADGLALMPGIVDNHTHYDAQLTWDPGASPSPALGVTTAVIGNCGFTIAPCRPGDRERIMRNLTQVEGMSLEALRAGIRWSFESVPEYLDQLERVAGHRDVPVVGAADEDGVDRPVVEEAPIVGVFRGTRPRDLRRLQDPGLVDVAHGH